MKRYLKRLRELKAKDWLAPMIFPFAYIVAKLFYRKQKDLILIGESRAEARDNGYWLFRYIREKVPEQRVAYVIDFDSPDYDKVRDLGECIPYGSFKHWVYYLSCGVIAVSQKECRPNTAFFYFLEVAGFLKNKRVFLQHGITISDAKWLYYDQTKFSGFICGAKPEYDAILNDFGYPDSSVRYLGFPRFDQLHETKVNPRQILLMPSWRSWLVNKTDARYEFNEGDDFTASEYFIKWNAFLSDPTLKEFLEKNDLQLIFYPHRNMQVHLNEFTKTSDHIQMASWKEHDIQDLLKSSAFMITDYSSVFMDFAYMKKPMLFYQFDQGKFRKGQYAKGYFDYEKDGFGPVIKEGAKQVVAYLEKSFANDFQLEEAYLAKIDRYFPLYDQNNSQRVYDFLKELLDECAQ
ncbi:CDP-glycerol glycerophosphotransferase family protein [Atopobacter sp. AH10]|uniref:CDP-glycerol glycerophosphotransferase family protein n=1 Tax=Atopobacter sp. AH10 TaxID=2315861 RepID=UPI001F33DAB4|nr:CDP-glycerol glycerophosphotransferase family protein [Atopobacter sp. AH10]